MYCSNNETDCITESPITRSAFEEVFYKYGVDLIIEAHEHTYERTLPVYQSKVCTQNESNPYIDPKAPVHIVTGIYFKLFYKVKLIFIS